MSLVNPRDLLLHQLSELLWIERTLFSQVLPSVHASVIATLTPVAILSLYLEVNVLIAPGGLEPPTSAL